MTSEAAVVRHPRRAVLDGFARTGCRSCGGELGYDVLDLGLMPVANHLLDSPGEIAGEARYPLHVRLCGDCLLAQVDYDVPPELVFADYAYFSSYSESWLLHARRYCEMARERFRLDSASLVVEIASNDGYLLRNFAQWGIPCLGIDPSDTVARAAIERGIETEIAFFGRETADRLAGEGRAADLVIANNVLAHVPDLNDFVAGVSRLLKPRGVLTAEFPHLLNLLDRTEFDTIYHEHYSYISLLALERCMARHGLALFDVEELPTHGGSLRVYAGHAASVTTGSARLEELRARERTAGLDRPETYRRFARRVETLRARFRDFLQGALDEGRYVGAYGAAAKGVTFLNYCGVTPREIACVADRSPHKQGRLLPGCHIPVVTPEELLERRPDDVVVLPWNLRDEIARQLAPIRAWKGRIVVALPELEIW